MALADSILELIENMNVPYGERVQLIEEARQVLAANTYETAEEADTNRQLFRHVISVEVLTDRPVDLGGWSLGDIDAECIDGQFSGIWNVDAVTAVSAEDMAELLQRQGSSPEFFGLDDLED